MHINYTESRLHCALSTRRMRSELLWGCGIHSLMESGADGWTWLSPETGVLTGGCNDSVWFIKHLALWLDQRPTVIISVAMNLELNWLAFKERGLLACNNSSFPGFISFIIYCHFRIRYWFHASLGLISPTSHGRQEWFCPVHMCRVYGWGGRWRLMPKTLGMASILGIGCRELGFRSWSCWSCLTPFRNEEVVLGAEPSGLRWLKYLR